MQPWRCSQCNVNGAGDSVQEALEILRDHYRTVHHTTAGEVAMNRRVAKARTYRGEEEPEPQTEEDGQSWWFQIDR